jgi:hypothetical protein
MGLAERLLINNKRAWRIYREEGLTVRRRNRRRVAAAPREPRPDLTDAN